MFKKRGKKRGFYIINGRFFKDIDWNSLNKQKGKQIYTPNLENADDMKLLNFINYDDEETNGINPDEDPFNDWIKKKDQ